jgi:hypothetical protein
MNYYRNLQLYFFKSFFLLFITIILSSCIDLSGSRSAYRKKAHSNNNHLNHSKKRLSNKGEVHTMRGGLGVFSIGMNQLRDSVSDKFHISSRSTMWYNAGDVSRSIIRRYYQQKEPRPIILVGHSLGANEQIKVARNLDAAGVPVALLVTVDAVSQTIIPPNVKHALNVYKPGYVPMFSGLKLRAVDPEKTLIENVNVDNLKGVNVNHFTLDKDDTVQAMILGQIEKVLINGNKNATQ